jgi:hypothetical protein
MVPGGKDRVHVENRHRTRKMDRVGTAEDELFGEPRSLSRNGIRQLDHAGPDHKSSQLRRARRSSAGGVDVIRGPRPAPR